jgi:hypothetical protein
MLWSQFSAIFDNFRQKIVVNPNIGPRFQKLLYPKLSVRYTGQCGWGLFAGQDLKRGDFVIEYVGELISVAEYQSVLDFLFQTRRQWPLHHDAVAETKLLELIFCCKVVLNYRPESFSRHRQETRPPAENRYFMFMDSSRIIDAGTKGNLARNQYYESVSVVIYGQNLIGPNMTF